MSPYGKCLHRDFSRHVLKDECNIAWDTAYRCTSGGDTVVKVGFELLLRTRYLGSCTDGKETEEAEMIHMSGLKEGLGSIMCGAGAGEYGRPFSAATLSLQQQMRFKKEAGTRSQPPPPCPSRRTSVRDKGSLHDAHKINNENNAFLHSGPRLRCRNRLRQEDARFKCGC